MRIALARLLLSEPDLLLLDEPTNHLDRGAKTWLGDYLSRYDGTLLLVSHDVPLLNTAVNSIAEVRGGTIELYKSRSHAQWEVEREERVRQAQAAYEANQREIARMQTFVDRFGAKTMGASLAQSKLKAIEKLEGQMPDGDVAAKMQAAPKAVLRLPAPPRGSQRLLELKGCTLAWPSSSAVGVGDASSPPSAPPSVLSDVSLTINRGSRIVVRGPNGAGKSTLLSALSGKLKPRAGERVEGDGLELGVFTQDLAQDLDQDDLAVNVVTKKVRERDATISDERARAALGALGLTGEKSVRKVGFLSGGEKARVALASFVLMRHNLLLLDEPSNHLDVTTLKVRRRWLLFIMEERASPPDLPLLGPAVPQHSL
jgi:ATPase subunit of ABC transporter with duplicated ATPase domains